MNKLNKHLSDIHAEKLGKVKIPAAWKEIRFDGMTPGEILHGEFYSPSAPEFLFHGYDAIVTQSPNDKERPAITFWSEDAIVPFRVEVYPPGIELASAIISLYSWDEERVFNLHFLVAGPGGEIASMTATCFPGQNLITVDKDSLGDQYFGKFTYIGLYTSSTHALCTIDVIHYEA